MSNHRRLICSGTGTAGEVSEVLRADAILVDGDPLANIRATRNIRRIWASGVSVTPN